MKDDRFEWDPPGVDWPLLFKCVRRVDGKDFDVRVTMRGRLLATIDPATGACSIDGVYPGALFAQGDSLDEANDKVISTISMLLEDIMWSSADVEEFRAQVQDFMQTTDDTTVVAWKSALDKVRSGQCEGAPLLPSHDVSDWSDFAVVEDVREEQSRMPLMAIPDTVDDGLLAACG